MELAHTSERTSQGCLSVGSHGWPIAWLSGPASGAELDVGVEDEHAAASACAAANKTTAKRARRGVEKADGTERRPTKVDDGWVPG
jgi:hypothetical protein